MSYRHTLAARNRRLDVMTDTTARPLPLDFGMSFDVMKESMLAEDISTSQDRAVQRFYGERDSALDAMIADGEIPASVVDENTLVTGINNLNGMDYTKPDYHALAQWSNENTGSSFDTDDTDMIQVLRAERKEREQLLANGNIFGMGLGGVYGAMHDPALWAATAVTLPVGGIGGGLVLRTALLEGIVGVVSEVPIQSEVAQFKERIDSPYTFEDALLNVAAAGVGGAVLGGAVQFGANTMLKYFGNKQIDAFIEENNIIGLQESTRPAEMEIVRLDSELREVGTAGDDDYLPATVGEHIDNLAGAEREINNPSAPEQAMEFEVPQEDLDMLVPTEDGEYRTIRELADEYDQEIKMDETRLDSIITCTLGGTNG